MNYPIVVIASNESDSKNILSNIRKISNDDNVEEFEDLKLYIHEIKTKYYQTKIALLPTEDVFNLSDAVKEKLEGVLINFNSHDRSFLESLPKYVELIKKYEIELSILLCKELEEDVDKGVTFKCIKDCYTKLDIIELEKNSDDDDDDGFENPTEELIEALKCYTWSNINICTDSNNSPEEENDEDIQNEIEKFENLLSQVMHFRPNTTSMSREDRLNYAQNFAELFEKLILQDEEIQNLPKE